MAGCSRSRWAAQAAELTSTESPCVTQEEGEKACGLGMRGVGTEQAPGDENESCGVVEGSWTCETGRAARGTTS